MKESSRQAADGSKSLSAKVEEHRATEARLREVIDRFEQVTNTITEVFWLTNADKTEIVYVSPGYERVWQRSCESLYSNPRSWLDAVLEADRSTIGHRSETEQAAGGYDVEYRVLRPDGSIRWVRDRAFPVQDSKGNVYRIAGIAEDITERKQAETALKQSEAQILDISDREQARIGQDIHDGLCQQLVSLAFDANALKRELEESAPAHASAVANMTELLDQAITEARRLARGLFPVRLEKDGLLPALEELSNSVSERFGIRCWLKTDPAIQVPSIAVATHLYRIAQEAVANAVQHAQPENVWIKLDLGSGQIELSVTDDGSGLPEAGTRSTTGMGLHIMAYRARSIGGTLRLTPRSEGGTVVTCSVGGQHPCESEPAASLEVTGPLLTSRSGHEVSPDSARRLF